MMNNGGGGGGQQGQAGGMDPGLCEPALLSQLVQLLGSRQRHSLLLSDLGALLPGHLRHSVKEKGGLRSWLQKYPQLFQVSGQPGKESVTLLLGTGCHMGARDAERAPPPMAAGGAGEAKTAAGFGSEQPLSELEQRKKEEDELNASAVQLRGLPYRAAVQDIKNFLGPHCANLNDDNAVQLVLNRDGRPSGFARIQFTSPAAARAARDEKHMQVMEVAGQPISQGGQGQERYVEIFLFAERPNKLRFKKTASADGGMNNEDEGVEALGITKEHVLMECCEHMRSPGKGQLLLSMLGVALSQGARLYLKKTDQGLKHFLAQYPNDFSVDGPKGRECISYLPALKGEGGQNNRDLPASFPDTQKKNNRRGTEGTGGPSTGSISDIPHENLRQVESGGMPRARWSELVPMSPKVEAMSPYPVMRGTPATGGNQGTPKEIRTPSDWGTPQPFGAHWAGQRGVDPNLALRDGAAGATDGPFGSSIPGYNNWSAWAMPPPTYWPGPPGVPMNFWSGGNAGAPPAVWGQDMEGRPDQPPDVNLGQPAWERAGAPLPFGAADPCPFVGGNGPSLASGGSAAPAPPALAVSASSAEAAAAGVAGLHGVLPMDAVLAALAEKMPGLQMNRGGPGGCARPPAPAAHGYGQGGPPPAVRLRGLPFSATEQDVYTFFGKHDVVERVDNSKNAVRMITKGNGKASGQVVVLLNSRGDIPVVQQVLNGQYMGQRYIEVFPHVEDDDSSSKHRDSGASLPAPPAVHQDGASFLDEAGDTGGSGSGGAFANGWQRQLWGQGGCRGDPGAPAGVVSAATAGVGVSEANGAGTGDGSTTDEAPSGASWEALFGFLKHGQEEPPMPPGAALHSLGGAAGMGLVDPTSVGAEAM